MRILYLHQYYCPPEGWGNNRSFEFAQHWAAQGAEVQVLTSTAYFPPTHEVHARRLTRLRHGSVEVWVLRVPYSQQMGFWRRIWAFLAFAAALLWLGLFKAKRPDFVYASSTPLTVGFVGRWIAWWRRAAFVFETVDVWPDVPIGMGILRNKYVNWFLNTRTKGLYRAAKAIVALSEGMKAQICSHGVLPDKVHVVHNGTDTQHFVPPVVRPNITTDNPLVFLYAGALGQANAVDQLVRDVAGLAAQFGEAAKPPFRLRIVGWGSHADAVHQAIARHNAEGYISIEPPIPKAQLPALFAQCHVGIVYFAPFPVLEANSANKFYDYLAAGLPVLLNYHGWQWQYLKDNQAGWGCVQGDGTGFQDAMRRVMQMSQSELDEVGRNARALAVRHFDRKALAQRTYELFVAMTVGSE